MEFKRTIRCAVHGSVAVITVNNPPVNSINFDVLFGFLECFTYLAEQPSLTAVILTGEGKAFIAGADIREICDGGDDFLCRSSKQGHEIFSCIENFPVPLIAAINGVALGGGLELAICCDILIASEKAKFGLPETALGIVPGWGGLSRLPKIVGVGQAKKIIFTAEHIPAARAMEIGLVQEVAPPEQLMERAMEIAEKISKNGPVAVREAKKVLNRAKEMSLQSAIYCEQEAVRFCCHSRDKIEGIDAFLKKRTPEFTNS